MARKKKVENETDLTTESKPKKKKKISTSGLPSVNINSWRPSSAAELFVNMDKKLFVCYFDHIFKQPNLKCYNRFFIGKSSYENQLDKIVNYINYFINYYDKDMELVTAYLRIKYMVDKLKVYDEASMNGYIDFLYEVIFTPSMVNKIRNIVEDNYFDDIETGDDQKKFSKNGKKHLESLEFTNDHIILLLSISFGIKILCPAMFHYVWLNNIDIGKGSTVIYTFYKRLFEIFSYGSDFDIVDAETDTVLEYEIPKDQVMEHVNELGLTKEVTGFTYRYYFTNDEGKKCYYTPTRINMYNKLYIYVKTKVLESSSSNTIMFDRREIFGVDIFSIVENFTNKIIISDNMVNKLDQSCSDTCHKMMLIAETEESAAMESSSTTIENIYDMSRVA